MTSNIRDTATDLTTSVLSADIKLLGHLLGVVIHQQHSASAKARRSVVAAYAWMKQTWTFVDSRLLVVYHGMEVGL